MIDQHAAKLLLSTMKMLFLLSRTTLLVLIGLVAAWRMLPTASFHKWLSSCENWGWQERRHHWKGLERSYLECSQSCYWNIVGLVIVLVLSTVTDPLPEGKLLPLVAAAVLAADLLVLAAAGCFSCSLLTWAKSGLGFCCTNGGSMNRGLGRCCCCWYCCRCSSWFNHSLLNVGGSAPTSKSSWSYKLILQVQKSLSQTLWLVTSSNWCSFETVSNQSSYTTWNCGVTRPFHKFKIKPAVKAWSCENRRNLPRFEWGYHFGSFLSSCKVGCNT